MPCPTLYRPPINKEEVLMALQIIKTPTGESALVVNHQLILEGDLADDSAKLVEQTG